jgi:beta-glucosidase
MASTWDVDLIHQLGQALAEECIALKVDVVLGPGANMKRTPLGGRNFEYYSEDPFLAGKMAVAFINGVQSKGVGTSLKHFAANNQEYQRLTISTEVDERSLREIYLAAFEMAVKEAQPWTVMCAYNKLNGTFCSENHYLLKEILEDEWGFEGFVVSDWGAVHERVASLMGGVDLEMPGPRELRTKAVVDAVRSGEVSEAALDESVRRILTIVFKSAQTPKGGEFDVNGHHDLARKVASEGIVLLKNNGLLPLKNPRHIAVIGHSAKEASFQGGGSSHINPTQVDIPFVELKKLAGEAELSFAEGYSDDGALDQGLIDEAVTLARSADVALLFVVAQAKSPKAMIGLTST